MIRGSLGAIWDSVRVGWKAKSLSEFHLSKHSPNDQAVHAPVVMKVLEGVIKYRWNALPVEQRDGIKNYISDLIVQVGG